MVDFIFNWTVGLLPWWAWGMLGLVAILFVRKLTGSWGFTMLILSAFSSLAALSRVRKAGERYERDKVEKRNEQMRKESQSIEDKVRNTDPAERSRDVDRFLRD